MQDCWSFLCCLSLTLGSLLKCSQLKSLFYKYQFGRCSSELAELVPLPHSQRWSTRYSGRLHHFSVTIPRCYNNAYVNGFFPPTSKLWNSLSIECFPLTYDLSDFKSRIRGNSQEKLVWFWDAALSDLFFSKICFIESSVNTL